MLVEKPGGARNVECWDVHIERSYELDHVMVPQGDGSYKIETVYADLAAIVWLKVAVRFWDDASAVEFETKIREVLPEVRP